LETEVTSGSGGSSIVTWGRELPKSETIKGVQCLLCVY
jgi:hypothetical protein